ncbi:MAG: hypothetical protein O9341_18065 [Paucibacter sp.]|nr:hypothetical protein [Roseateles sp.]
MTSETLLTTISRLQLGPDETLVVSTSRVLSRDQHKAITAHVTRAVAGLTPERVLILEDSMTLHVISTSQAQQLTGGARHGS